MELLAPLASSRLVLVAKMKREQPRLLTILFGLAIVGATGCTQDFRVRRADSAPSAASASASGPTAAALSAQQCVSILGNHAVDPGGRAARREAADRLVTLYASALLTARGHTLRLPAGSGQITLTLGKGSGQGGVDPSDYVALEPADNFVVDYVDHFSRTSGEGAPLVGTLCPLMPVNAPGMVPARPTPGIIRALTVVATVNPGASPGVTLSLYDPRLTSRELAADYTTPLAVNLSHFRPQRRGLMGFIRGNEYFSATGLYPLETPTPDKTPLVLVHGLNSDPGDFYHLENDLVGNAEVRRRYQVWVFYYPTSLPVVYSATLLREDVDLFIHRLDPNGVHPALHRAVLIGHSMGGLISRIAISNGGDSYYRHFFRVPLDQLKLSAGDRSMVRHTLLSPGTANVAQVVFIATPHRGSSLASGPLGGFGRMLLHMPSALQGRLHAALVRNQDAVALKGHLRVDSSLDSLGPKSRAIAAVNDLSIRPGVRLHSIIGDRGGGGPREKSSDGVVPYASSHLPQAESELMVPAGHTTTLLRPETSAEVIRILRH